MDALFLMKCVTFGAFFIGGIIGVALGSFATKLLEELT